MGATPPRPEPAAMHDDPIVRALQLIHSEQVAQRDRLGRLQDQVARVERTLMKIEVGLTLTTKVYTDEDG